MTTTGMKLNRGKCLALAAVLAMVVCAFAVALPTNSDAADIVYYNGDISKDQNVATGVIAEVNGDMNIKNGATFTVSAGATLTVNTGVKVTVDGQGTADKGVSVLNAKFVVEDGARLVINGEFVIGQYGEAELVSEPNVVPNAETGIYAGTFVYGSITAQDGGVLSIIAEVMDGGSVTVTSNGNQVSTIGGILATLGGATVNINGNIADVLVIGAVGMDLSKAIATNTDNLGAAVMLVGTEEDNATDVSQLTFTSTTQSNTVYSSGTKTTVLVSYLDVSGVIKNAYLTVAHSENVEYEDKATGGKTVELSSAVTVTGNLDVTNTGSLSVGTIEDVYIPDTDIEAPNMMVSGTVTVADGATLGFTKGKTTVSGTFTVNAKLIYVAPAATVDDSIIKDLNSVVFQMQGADFMTVYGHSGTEVEAVEPIVEDAKFICWYLSTDESQTAQTSVVIGTEVQTMVAKIKTDIYTVTVIGDDGIGTVIIDGHVLAKNSNVFTINNLEAGTHTITVEKKYGYEGTPVINVNGTVVSDGTFTLSGTSDEDTSVTIDVSGTVPVTPDNGMKITDYLLIVLIVILAIIGTTVVMRK